MKKRFLGAVLAAAMMISSLPGTVSAAMERNWVGNENLIPVGWSTKYEIRSGASWTAEQKANSYIGLTTAEAHTGNAAMYFKLGEGFPTEGYVRVNIKLNNALLQSATDYDPNEDNVAKYRISFYKKGKGFIRSFYNNWKEDNSWYHIDPLNTSGSSAGEDDDNWYLYWRDISVNTGEDYTTLSLYTAAASEFIIDDVSIRQYTSSNTLSNVELVPNGGFEQYADLSGKSDSVDYLGGWAYPPYSGSTLWTKEHRDKSYAGITTASHKSGKASMFVKFDGALDGTTYIRLKNTLAAPLTNGKTYRLSYWSIGGGPVTYFDSWAHNSGSYNSGETVDGWTYKYRDITVGGNYSNLYLYNDSIGTKYLIDDISLREISNGVLGDTEYIVNGDFEGMYTINPSDRNKAMGWNETYNGINDRANQYMTVTSADARNDSGYSLYSHFENDYADNVYTAFRQDVEVEAGKTYVFEAWIKGHIFRNNSLLFREVEKKNWIAEVLPNAKETDGDWTRYAAEYTADSTGKVSIGLIATGVHQCYIDDVAMYDKNDVSQTNLITNGGFEQIKQLERTHIVNPICYPIQDGNGLNISWTNPCNENISAIKVYLGDAEQQEAVVDTTSEAFNSVLLSGLDNGQEYKVKIVTTVDGEEHEYSLTGIPYNSSKTHLLSFIGNRPTKTWNVHKWDYEGQYANFITELDTVEKTEGDYSFKMTANIPKVENNIYPGLAQEIKGLKRNKEYVLTFSYKADGVSAINISNDARIDGTVVAPDKNPIVPVNGDWQTVSVPIVKEGGAIYDPEAPSAALYDTTLFITSTQMAGTLWIDDVKLQEYDSFEEVLSPENLLADGGFEYTDTYSIEAPTFEILLEDGYGPMPELLGGNVKVTAKIRNFAAGDNLKACVVAAVYDGGRLCDVQYMEKTVKEVPYALPAEEYVMFVDVPTDCQNCEIKILYWDGMGTMEPIGDISSLKATQVTPETSDEPETPEMPTE